MAGQGRPPASSLARPSGACKTQADGARRFARVTALASLAFVFLFAAPVLAESLRVRVSWGGNTQRTWHGEIAVSQGAIVEFRPLGVEPDEPGSMWLDGREGEPAGRLIVRQASPRVYDSAELLLDAPLDAELSIELAAIDATDQAVTTAVPLKELLANMRSKDLDNQGNRVLVHRAPGDHLRAVIDRDHLVFAPGEMFKFHVEPNLLPLPTGGKAKLRVQQFAARSQRELWSTTHNIVIGQTNSIPIEVPLREEEGAYDIALSVVPVGGWPQAVRQPLTWNKPVADRTIQVMVVGSQPAAAGKGETELQQMAILDPANPRWAELLSKLPQAAKLPRLLKSPLGNGNLQTFRHPLGELARLRPNGTTGDVSWEAYTLPVGQPGKPHVLEIEYPSDVPQTLGVSILEPDAAGALVPGGIDSGVEVVDEPIGRGQRMLKHRLIFWPRTVSPLLLMTNRRTGDPAVYGKIHVLAGWDRLPRLAASPKAQGSRVLAAWLDRPVFAENFSATQVLDAASSHNIEDWTTFHEGGLRLVEYLNYCGYGGLFLNVAADGSAIYPAETLVPTPRLDKGTLLATGQDALRKDVVELLARMFDRQHLALIPAVDFCTPLPALEAVVRKDGSEADALRWIGADGTTLQQSMPPRRGQSPYYNTLNPRVQEAMLSVIRELATRYAEHPSFGGVAIQFSAFGYAQLPGPEWGLDDATIRQFETDTRIRVAGTDGNRFAMRAEFLGGPGRAAWLTWRAEVLGRFYRRMAEELRAIRPDARLYLAGANMFAGPEWQNLLRPALPQRLTLAEAMLRAGVDPQQFPAEKGVVLFQPEKRASSADPAEWAVQAELGRMPDFERIFQQRSAAASLFFQEPCETRVESFDQKSPFKPAYTLLKSQFALSDRQDRRRFVHSLAALDAHLLVDGGWMLPLGQEESLRGFAAAYRRLPAVTMVRLGGDEASSTQPVVLRSAQHAGRTWLYAVNDSPVRAGVRIRVDAPANCRIEELSGQRAIEPLKRDGQLTSWSIDLEPYDLVAVAFSRGDVVLSRPEVTMPEAVEVALNRHIRDLGSRAAALRNPPAVSLLSNPSFERTGGADDPLPDWLITRQAGVRITPDTKAHAGERCARLASDGPVACLVSKPFAAPTTGRLSMSVWLRTADPNHQPPLRLALEGRTGDQPYYRYAEVGAGNGAVAIGGEWSQFVFPVDDIPLEGMSQLRVRFDLMGAGAVGIDDVQLYDLAFSEKERRELAKLITVAEYQLQNKQVGDCIRLLDGYWPRCLRQRLDGEGTEVAANPAAPRTPTPAESKPPRPGMIDRMKDIVPDRLRL